MTISSYTSGTSTIPLLGMTIGEKFDDTANKYPDQDALIVHHQNIKWTYKKLQYEVNRCARALITCGLKKGDRVGIWSTNRSEWTVIQLATAKVGIILVNINPSYRLHELKYALNQSGCTMLVLTDQFKTSDYTSMILKLAPELRSNKFGELNAKEIPELRMVVTLAEASLHGLLAWSDFLHFASETPETELDIRASTLAFDEPINIQYTSGTTGFPKGATLSHHNILNNGYFVTKTMNFTTEDRLVIPVPLYHCFGMVMGNLGCICHGATMIYPSQGFEPDAVLKAVEKEKATAVYGVPTMFIAMLEHPDFGKFNLTSLRTGIMAGSPCPIEVMKKVQTDMHMSEVQIAYGMTETSPVSTQTRPGTPLDKQVSTVGQVHPHIEIKIIDSETGLVVPIGQGGELCTRGYSVMLGYWNDETRSREAIDSARWMHTGDIAIMDDEGYINIVGRIKDMIIRGGENIYPREIEEFLYTHPDISDVQVIGIPSAKYGEEVMAWVKIKEGSNLSSEQIKDFCEGQITHFKIPKFYKFTDDFPMTVTGKIRKIEMRKISIKELGLEADANVNTA